MRSSRYDITVQGTLPDALRSAFGPYEATVRAGGSTTTLSAVVDQSRLTGILETIDSLGLVLVEVRPSVDPRDPGDPGDL